MKNAANLVEFYSMIIFLYGQDTYRLKQKLKEITEHYKEVHRSGLNLIFFEGKNLSYQDFRDEFQQTPMFQEKKMVILKNVFSNQEFKDSFLEKGKSFADSKDIVVFAEEGEIPAKDPLFKFLVSSGKVQEFGLLVGAKLRNWAKSEIEKYKIGIRPEALELLVGFIGNDLWQLANEIKKLAAFKKDKTIESADINLLVRPQVETDIFKTVEALALKNKREALSLVHRHLDNGDSPLYLLSMITFQFRNLLLMKKMGKLAGHPFFVRKTAALARSFTLDELTGIYKRIFETDLKIKTGQLDPQLALDLLITGI